MLIATLVWIVIAQVPTTPMTGTVVDFGGKPVVGADLILVGLPSYDPPIVARGKSGEGGRFSLDRPIDLSGDHHLQRAPILWALKPGFRASGTRFPEVLPKPDEPVRVVLEPPGRAEVQVEGPDGQPVSGAKVWPEHLKADYPLVPDVVAELASATTRPDGLAVLDAVAPEDLTYVDVHTREFGIQGRRIVPRPGKPTVIALRPALTWKGRLTAEDPKHARGWRVRAWTRVGGASDTEPPTTGYVATTTDDDGRFTLAPIAVGGLQFDLKPPGDLPVLVDLSDSLAVRAGGVESVDIPLRKAITVTGLILERGTRKPVPGIQVSLIDLGSHRNRNERVKTDETGRYTLRTLPGKVRVSLLSPPPTHVLMPGQHWLDVTVPEGSKPIELATREALPAAPPLRGEVRDEAGRIVAGAEIDASWMLAGAGGSSDGHVVTSTDDKGGFALEGLGPDSTVTITARFRDRRTKEPVKARAGETALVKVAIAPTPLIALAGRLIGPGGAPLAGIPVKVQFRQPEGNSHRGFAREAGFEGARAIRSAADGTFRTQKALDRKSREYRVEVSMEGFLPARTAWLPLPEGDLLTLPDLSLKAARGIRVVSGRVVDREGKAVSGASVLQAGDASIWTSVKADADGRFRLAGVSGGKALVFAEASGFRFGGSIVGAGADPVEIRLARVSEPPIRALKSLPSSLSRPEERALARDLLEPLLPMARSGLLGAANDPVIPALARVDPARVLEMIENRAIANLSGDLYQVALAQFEDDPASAIATIRDDLDPASRASGWLALEDFCPALDRARREDLLDRALADARRTPRAEVKIMLLGRIADRWLGLGAIEKARPILVEGREIEAAWPKTEWHYEAEEFAEVLAVIDLPAALALFERRGWTNVTPADVSSINRHKGQAAIRLARIDPAEAERLIAPASANFHERPGVVLKAARRMAKADLPRALRLLNTIADVPSPDYPSGPALVPFGLGGIADELSQSDPIRARGLLDEAFARLRKLAVDGQPGRGRDAVVNQMAALLPVVERLDPGKLDERIWLIAASRAAPVLEPRAEDVEGMLVLAMLVARYDRGVADVIAVPAIERLPGLLVDLAESYGYMTPAIAKSLTAYDPRTLAPLLRTLPDPARKPPPKIDAWNAASVESQFRLAAAQILGVPYRARPREVGRALSYAWPYRPGDEW